MAAVEMLRLQTDGFSRALLRRRELSDLDFTHLQQREERWAIVDLVGKAAIFGRSLCPTG